MFSGGRAVRYESDDDRAEAAGRQPVFSIEYESTTGQELIDNVAKSIEYFNKVATELANPRDKSGIEK